MFTCVEKPGIDARVVYKNKFELERMENKRIEWFKSNAKKSATSPDIKAVDNCEQVEDA